MSHFYAIIMAGGGGTRLWPFSRQNTPKQLLKLFGDRTLFQLAVDRLQGLFAFEHIYVVTIAEQAIRLQQQYPEIPVGNYLIEPAPRGTASVVAMAAAALKKRDPEAVLAILTADHFIQEVHLFQQALASAYELAKNNYIVTLGIKPTFASTGYGYIESGEQLGKFGNQNAYDVLRFVEKPDEGNAKIFLKNPSMNWNSGMFISRVDTLLGEFQAYMPQLADAIQMIQPFLGEDHTNEEFQKTWLGINPQTIDYGIMEKSNCTAVIPVDEMGWSDIGSWDSLFDMIRPDEQGNIILNAKHIGLNTSHSLIASTNGDRLIVTLGMRDVIIVETLDAIMICPRGESQQVKELVAYLKQNHYTLYL